MDALESMEDSGIDSDQKTVQNGTMESPIKSQPEAVSSRSDADAFKALRKTSQLQKKLEKQREATRKAQSTGEHQLLHNKKGSGLLSRSRLVIPGKRDGSVLPPDQQPLVMLETDDSEDEFVMQTLSKTAQKEITQQLIKDGYNLDLEPDDEDLDLIPPRPLEERCTCCQFTNPCSMQ